MLLRYRQSYLFVYECAFLSISYRLLLVSAKDATREVPNRYSYDFNVTSVKRCPMNKTEHEEAEARLGCSGDQGYHCTPDKYHLNLIEFCYTKKRILVHTGNCLELAHIGILNHVKCQNFSCGCPEKPYFSNEIYRYPACLSLAFECFTSDKTCLREKSTMRPCEKIDSKQDIDSKEEEINVFMVLFIITASILIVLGVLAFILKRKNILVFGRKTKRLKDNTDNTVEKLLPTSTCAKDANETIPLYARNQTEEILGTSSTSIELTSREVNVRNETEEIHRSDPEELECEHMLEDMELLALLRRHCLNGAFENFNYLLETRILNKADEKLKKILESRDRDGRSLLHYAAKGGSSDILEALLKHCNELKMEDKDHLGHTLLHLACKHDKYDICAFLLSEEKPRILKMIEPSKHMWSAAHFAASCGNMRIFQFVLDKQLLLDKRFEVNSVTGNGLNILDIACINNKTDFCKKLIKRHGELNLSLEKTDDRGWNIAHIAARVGNKDLLEFLLNGYIDIQMAKSKTNHKKTILHICCEYGHYEVCRFIVENDQFKDILNDIDDRRWNALHFCAKGGDIKAYKLIESKNILDDKVIDGKTVLHICCIHKNVEICKYVCEKLMSSTQRINDLTTNKLWTPAHYVAVEIRQDGTEENLIRILVRAGIDLKAKSEEDNTVLVEACKHRNTDLVKYLVKHHRELLAVEPDKVKHAARCDPEIKQIIYNAYGLL